LNPPDAVGVLQGDPIANPIFEGIWNVRKSYEQLVTDAGNIIAFLVQEPRNRSETIAAVWALWYIKAKLRIDVVITPPLRHTVLAMLKAVAVLRSAEPAVYKLLWESFLHLVQFEFGDRMEVKKEQEAIELVGLVTAQIEFSTPASAAPISLKDRLLKGITEGTVYHAWFMKSYSDAYIQHATKSMKNKPH
jgi:hypothetical protein